MKHKLWKGLALLLAVALLVVGIPMLVSGAGIDDEFEDPIFWQLVLDEMDALGAAELTPIGPFASIADAILAGLSLADITSLNVSGKGIRSLAGLDNLVGLLDLDVSDNLLDEISITDLTALVVLDEFHYGNNYLDSTNVTAIETLLLGITTLDGASTNTEFVAVTGIAGLPAVWEEGIWYTLPTLSALQPAGATAVAMGVEVTWSGDGVIFMTPDYYFVPSAGAGIYNLTATVPFSVDLDNAATDNDWLIDIEVFAAPFTPVTGLIDAAMAGLEYVPGSGPLDLTDLITGTVPSDATFQDIKWEVLTNTFGAAISANGTDFVATAAGIATVRLTIENGAAYNPPKAFVADYQITVVYEPVTNVTLPTAPIIAGTEYDLTALATISPSNAAVLAGLLELPPVPPVINWTVTGTTPPTLSYTLVGDKLTVLDTAGMVTLTAVVVDGVGIGTDFPKTGLTLTVTYAPTVWDQLLTDTYVPGEELMLAASFLSGSYQTVDEWEYSTDGGFTWLPADPGGVIPASVTLTAGMSGSFLVQATVNKGTSPTGTPPAVFGPYTVNEDFKPLTNITVPTTPPAIVGEQYTLVPTFTPPDATFQDIEWTCSDPAVTIVGNVLTATAAGTYTITATVENGETVIPQKDYTKDFTIKVNNVPVTDIDSYPTTGSTNVLRTFNAQVVATTPPATFTTITDWICVSAPAGASIPVGTSLGTTGFTPPVAGTYGILIAVLNGLEYPTDVMTLIPGYSGSFTPAASTFYKYIEIVVSNKPVDDVQPSPAGIAPGSTTSVSFILFPISGPTSPPSAVASDVEFIVVEASASVLSVSPPAVGFSGFSGATWTAANPQSFLATLQTGQLSGTITLLVKVKNGLANAGDTMPGTLTLGTAVSVPYPANDGCFYKVVTINVTNQKVTGVTVSPYGTANAGVALPITATVLPSNATSTTIEWEIVGPFPAGYTAGDAAIPTSTVVGNVNTFDFVAKKAGTYWIRGKIVNGTPGEVTGDDYIMQDFAINVVNVPVGAINVDFLDMSNVTIWDVVNSEYSINAGETFQLKATLTGGPTDTEVQWRITSTTCAGVTVTPPGSAYDTYQTDPGTDPYPTLTPTSSGTITISATVAGGTASGTPVTVSRTINVKNKEVTGLSGLPAPVYVGSPLAITCVLEPAGGTTATAANITWSVDKVVLADGTPVPGTNARIQTIGGNPYVVLDNRGDPLLTKNEDVYVLLKAVVAGGSAGGGPVTFVGDQTATAGTAKELAIPVLNVKPTAVLLPGGATEFIVNANANLTLSGAVSPPNATYKTIVWDIASAGGTGATVTNGVFKATTPGTATVTATIVNGGEKGEDVSFTFDVKVKLVEVTSITGIPKNLQAGTYTLNGTVNPPTATYKDIVWTATPLTGNTGANIQSGNKLVTTGAGTLMLTATITGIDETGATYTYTEDFPITVTIMGVTNIFLSTNTVPPNALTNIDAFVTPSSATVQDIEWETIIDTPDFLVDGTDYDWFPQTPDGKNIDVDARDAGAIKVKATIKGGKSDGSDYVQEFIVYVASIVLDIINVPETATAGVPLQLTWKIISDNPLLTVEWEMIDANSTWGTVTKGGVLNATRSGKVLLRATVVGGNPATPDNPQGKYVKYFEIDIQGSVGPGIGTGTSRIILGAATVNPRHTTTISVKDAVGKVTYYTSDPKIATVDENGKILGKKPGTVTITAVTSDGYKEDVTIKVKYNFWQWLLVIFLFGWCWVPLK